MIGSVAMQSRMDKYRGQDEKLNSNENVQASSRVSKNQDLYKEVSYAELDNFDLKTLSSSISSNISL